MFLKSLKISNGISLIREINFHKGLNLIVDNTPQSLPTTETGNDVGKTTILRLIDYCLGGDGKNIYTDSEFKNHPNTYIEDFLKNNDIIIETILVSDLDNPNYDNIVIRRNFKKYSKKIQEINGVNFTSDKKFSQKLKKIIFKTKVEKPTFRQIISKNIRDEKHKMSNIVRVLNPYTSLEAYEALFLFWLGISNNKLEQKQKLSEDKKREENFQRRLKKEGELSLIQQQLTFINDKIKDLKVKRDIFSISEEYANDIEKINTVKIKLNATSTLIGRLKMRLGLIIESKHELEKEFSKIDTNKVKILYAKASSLIKNIQVSFEDTVSFHNDL